MYNPGKLVTYSVAIQIQQLLTSITLFIHKFTLGSINNAETAQ